MNVLSITRTGFTSYGGQLSALITEASALLNYSTCNQYLLIPKDVISGARLHRMCNGGFSIEENVVNGRIVSSQTVALLQYWSSVL